MIDIEEVMIKVDEQKEKDHAETMAMLKSIGEEKKSKLEGYSSMLSKALSTEDKDINAMMNAEIEVAKVNAEQEVRAKYKNLYGDKDWNADTMHNGLVELVQTINQH